VEATFKTVVIFDSTSAVLFLLLLLGILLIVCAKLNRKYV